MSNLWLNHSFESNIFNKFVDLAHNISLNDYFINWTDLVLKVLSWLSDSNKEKDCQWIMALFFSQSYEMRWLLKKLYGLLLWYLFIHFEASVPINCNCMEKIDQHNHQNFIFLPLKKESLTGLEQHDGEYMITEFSFIWVNYPFKLFLIHLQWNIISQAPTFLDASWPG